MKFLLDTCFISELVKAEPDRGVARWADEHDEMQMYLSVVTLGELHKGIAKLPESARRHQLAGWVEEDLAQRFEHRVFMIDGAVAETWGRISGEAERRGEPLPVIDALIGATALVHGCTVITRNERDLARTSAEVINPWR